MSHIKAFSPDAYLAHIFFAPNIYEYDPDISAKPQIQGSHPEIDMGDGVLSFFSLSKFRAVLLIKKNTFCWHFFGHFQMSLNNFNPKPTALFGFSPVSAYCLPDKNVNFGNTSKYKCFANLQLIVNIHHLQIFGNWRLFFGLKRLCPQRRIRDTSLQNKVLIYEKYSLIQNYSFIQNYFTIAILNKRIL